MFSFKLVLWICNHVFPYFFIISFSLIFKLNFNLICIWKKLFFRKFWNLGGVNCNVWKIEWTGFRDLLKEKFCKVSIFAVMMSDFLWSFGCTFENSGKFCPSFPFPNCQKFPFPNYQNFPFPNCQNFPFQTVKTFFFQTVWKVKLVDVSWNFWASKPPHPTPQSNPSILKNQS